MTPPIVRVLWTDAAHRGFEAVPVGTRIPADELMIQTVGWLIHEDDVTLTLAEEYWPDSDFCRHYTTIPKGLVRERSEVADCDPIVKKRGRNFTKAAGK